VEGCPYRFYEVVSEDPRIGYIRVPDFDGDSAFSILESINAMEEEQPLEGLIMFPRPPSGKDIKTHPF